MSSTTNDNKRIAKNTAVLYVRSIIMLLIGLYTSRVVLQVLGIEDYGIYNVVGGIVTMFSMLNGALSSASQRFITFALGKGNKNEIKKVFSTCVTLHFLLGLIIVVVLEIAGVWFLNNKLSIPIERLDVAGWVLQFSIATFFVNVISVPYNALITAHEKMSAFAYIGILDSILRLGIVLIIPFFSFDRLLLYGILQLSVSISIRSVYTIYCKRKFDEANRLNWMIDKPLFKEMFAFSGWNLLGNGSLVLRNQGVDILLNIFYGITINAAKGVSNQVQSAVHKLVGDFTTSIRPQLTKSIAIGDLKRAHSLMNNGSRYSFYLMMVFSIPIIITTPKLLALWLTVVPDYSVDFVRLTMFYLLCDSLSRLLINAILANGNIRNYQIVVAGVKLLAMPLVYIALKMGAGALVGVWVNIILEIVCLALRIRYSVVLLEFNALSYIKQVILRCLVVFLAAFIPSVIFYMYVTDNFILTGGFSLLFTCLSIWFIGLKVIERNMAIDYIRKYIKR